MVNIMNDREARELEKPGKALSNLTSGLNFLDLAGRQHLPGGSHGFLSKPGVASSEGVPGFIDVPQLDALLDSSGLDPKWKSMFDGVLRELVRLCDQHNPHSHPPGTDSRELPGSPPAPGLDPKREPEGQPEVGSSPHMVTRDGRRSDLHPDLNLDWRGYNRIDASKNLIDMGGDTDDRAPQLASLFSKQHGMPEISNTYRVNDWDWNQNKRGAPLTQYEATMVGFRTKPGEPLFVPRSGYEIDSEGHQAMVLYKDDDSMTINYTAEGTVAPGYTIHIEGIRARPDLKEGSRVSASDLLGTARGDEVRVSIRDTGTFMDPRVRKDWWQNLDQVG